METVSHPLTRLAAANSDNVDYDGPGVRETEPTDGAYVAGLGGSLAPQQILLVPFGEGQGQFKLRIYGWYHVGPAGAASEVLWIPLVLAEFEITLGSTSGRVGRKVAASERFANRIELLSGGVGQYGAIVDGPIAFAKVDLHGVQKYSFDFAQGTLPGALGNCLFAETSSF